MPDEMRDDCEAVMRGELSPAELRERHGPPPVPRLKRIDREQVCLRTVVVEELISAEHPARAIWELTGTLDLSLYLGRIRAVAGVAGREHTDPRLLVSLWLYGLSEGVSSAREIARRCEYHPAYQWLCGLAEVNYHTLSSFRVAHQEGLEGLFIEQLGLLSQEGFIDLTEVMHDGTKVLAQAGSGSFKREEKLAAHLAMAQQLVAELTDDEHGEACSKRHRAARKRAREEQLERLKLAQKELEKVRALKGSAAEKEAARASESDPEARVMKQSDGGFGPSYNVQVTTDAKEKIIVAVAATQSGADGKELAPAVDRVAENFGALPVRVVADGGFTTRGNILAMAAQGIEFIGALGDRTSQTEAGYARRGVDKKFRGEAFSYDELTDTFICPNQQVLNLKRVAQGERAGVARHIYQAAAKDCAACSFQQQCCPGKKQTGREVVRMVEDAVITTFREQMERDTTKDIYRRRSEVAEFPHLWIKDKLGLRRFRLRGLVKVGMEALWACLTYNIQQWIRLSWRPRLRQASAAS